ncbi:MAG: hypothetical protein IJR66_04645 [Clostridia bacterium]|nr:hypothetical protein [Clostridia bacterium]
MKNGILKKSSDTAFVFVACFLLSFFIFNYFTKRPYSYVLALSLSLAVSVLAFKIISSAYISNKNASGNSRLVKNTLNHLCLSKEKDVKDLFYSAFIKKGYVAEIKRRYILLPKEKLQLFFVFSFDGLTKKDVVAVYNMLSQSNRAVIYTNEISEEVKDFVIRFNKKINVFYGKEVFDFLKDCEVLPDIDFVLEEITAPKITAKTFIEKKKAKNYFVFGIIFLLLSFFVPLKLYYIIAGGIMISLSLFARLFGYIPEKKDAYI